MKRLAVLALMAITMALTGCANSGFAVATAANTARGDSYMEGYLEQAANDLITINTCFLQAGKTNVNVTASDGSPVLVGAIMQMMGQFQCTSMAQSLRLANTFLYAFLAKPEMSRVPAAPEEIVQSIVKDGMKFALMKFGITAVTKVVESGQAAQAQIASEGITAASKPPLVVDKPVIVTVPAGSAVLPTTPAVPAPAVTP